MGYGDFSGGTTTEYLVTIVVEFIGIIVFAVLALLVNTQIKSGLTYEQMIASKFRLL